MRSFRRAYKHHAALGVRQRVPRSSPRGPLLLGNSRILHVLESGGRKTDIGGRKPNTWSCNQSGWVHFYPSTFKVWVKSSRIRYFSNHWVGVEKICIGSYIWDEVCVEGTTSRIGLSSNHWGLKVGIGRWLKVALGLRRWGITTRQLSDWDCADDETFLVLNIRTEVVISSKLKRKKYTN